MVIKQTDLEVSYSYNSHLNFVFEESNLRSSCHGLGNNSVSICEKKSLQERNTIENTTLIHRQLFS